MVARLSVCDRRQLQLALADRLVPAQADDLSDHLQGCPHCRSELEQLAGDGQWWTDAKTFLSSTDELVAVEEEFGTRNVRSGNGTGSAPDADDDPPPLDFLAPSDRPGMLGRLGSYEIEEIVGRGGMGIVLKAQDPALDRRVAIKVLAGHLATSAAARKRFAYEAKAAAAVVHDHIIPIHAVDTSGRTPFLVMPFVTGRSLQDRLDEHGVLEIREVLRIGMQTAAGLAAAHAQGLVHRDIKPANILLENGCERVRITDFGLARAVDDASQTQSGFLAGTPQYMSPEQARGAGVDARADLFSLGSVLYAMCTGRPPFRAETTLAVLRRICDDAPRSVREVNPDVPLWLAGIIEKLLAKSPADRFQSAGEVADLLQQWLAHLAEPTTILPPKFVATVADKSKAATRRWQRWVAAIAAVGGAVAIGCLIAWLGGLIGSTGPASDATSGPPHVPPAAAGKAAPDKRDSETSTFRAADQAFAAELIRAQYETSQVESELLHAPGSDGSIAQELAELTQRVEILEQELFPQPVPVSR